MSNPVGVSPGAPSTVTVTIISKEAVTGPNPVRDASFSSDLFMQYAGYWRRNPNATPDTDFAGYNFWLDKLNLFGGNFVNAER